MPELKESYPFAGKLKCPCCRITNTLAEYNRHPSITSFKALDFACVAFNAAEMEDNVTAIKTCDHHSDGARLGNWFDVLLADAKSILAQGFVMRWRKY